MSEIKTRSRLAHSLNVFSIVRLRSMIQQSIKLVIFYSVIQILVSQQLRQFTMNVFVLLRIESERVYEVLQLAIELFNRHSQDSIIIREQIFDLIRRRKSTI
jgi:PHP family Zn ribbon phosphoesterase